MEKKEMTGKEKRMMNLRQNKIRQVPEDLEKYVPEHIPLLLNAVEKRIYFEEVRGWIKSHPEWTIKEDVDDINGIAMEKVIQYRLFLLKKQTKNADIEDALSKSKSREFSHKGSLGAKRTQRIQEGSKKVSSTNIIMISGKIDDDQIKKIRTVNMKEDQEEDELFKKVDIIDVCAKEVIEQEK